MLTAAPAATACAGSVPTETLAEGSARKSTSTRWVDGPKGVQVGDRQGRGDVERVDRQRRVGMRRARVRGWAGGRRGGRGRRRCCRAGGGSGGLGRSRRGGRGRRRRRAGRRRGGARAGVGRVPRRRRAARGEIGWAHGYRRRRPDRHVLHPARRGRVAARGLALQERPRKVLRARLIRHEIRDRAIPDEPLKSLERMLRLRERRPPPGRVSRPRGSPLAFACVPSHRLRDHIAAGSRRPARLVLASCKQATPAGCARRRQTGQRGYPIGCPKGHQELPD